MRRRAVTACSLILVLLALSLPVSTTGLGVAGVLLLLLWPWQGDTRERWAEMRASPLCRALALYLGLHVAGLLWSPDRAAGLEVLKDQWKLALLPLVMTTARPGDRRVLAAFVLACSAMALFTLLVAVGLVHVPGLSPEHPTSKVFHVVFGPMLALAACLCGLGLMDRGPAGLRPAARPPAAALLLLLVVTLFLTEGRTGQAVFVVLALLLAVRAAPPGRRACALAAGLLLAAQFLLLAFHASPTFQRRVVQACHEVAAFRENPDTSVGLRLLYARNTLEVVAEHPLLGTGTGGFVPAYREVNARRSPGMPDTDNPHNQYLLAAARLGLPGLAALVLLLGAMVRTALRGDPAMAGARLALAVFFAVIMLAESYLRVVETGFLFAVLGGTVYKRRPGESL